jgi:hypothetical protein
MKQSAIDKALAELRDERDVLERAIRVIEANREPKPAKARKPKLAGSEAASK